MPLSRYALYAQGVEVYIAPTYDYGDGWIGTLQHIAREGRCWVIGSGTVLRARDIPETFPKKISLYPDPEEWINPGDSVVIKPGGKIVSGPMRNEEGILYGEIDSDHVAVSRRTLDVAGHYSRPDIFQLHINRKPLKPVTFEFESLRMRAALLQLWKTLKQAIYPSRGWLPRRLLPPLIP
jgi:nitrilase